MEITGSHLIAGVESRAGVPTFTSVDPRTKTTGTVRFHDATAAEIDQAAHAAAAAFEITRHYPPGQIAELLDNVAVAIESLGDQLLETADLETGLGIPRLTNERGRTTNQLRAFADLLREGSYVEAIIDTGQPDRQPTPRPDIRRMLLPIGPAAVFAASNFPFAFSVAGGDTASAWAAGCPVILKAHPGHPATSELTARAINRAIEIARFPAGFFSLIQGQGIEVGQMLVEHPSVQAVGFTGSLRAGRAIYETAARRPTPIPVYAEMGSINPLVLLPRALETRAASLADGLVGSVTLGAGQFCTNPGLVIVPNVADTDSFIELVRAKMTERDPGVLLNEHIEAGVKRAVATTTTQRAVEVLTGAGDLDGAAAYCYPNTVLRTTDAAFLADPEALQTEHFGPVTLFVVCDTLETMQQVIRALHGHLTATIHAEEDEAELAGQLYDLLREKAGRLIWNGYPTGVEVVAAMQHGGPYPATTAPATTSVGTTAIKRWLRPVAYQNLPDVLLPEPLQNSNPRGIWRTVDGHLTRDPITR
ncbi:MAG: aldehyde dehydrogenase (NADP(+)) [Chloroflexi bacterium]|nr:aldehyde dehydrogenase (NADP(+)) [Chloroflexota bacterium]